MHIPSAYREEAQDPWKDKSRLRGRFWSTVCIWEGVGEPQWPMKYNFKNKISSSLFFFVVDFVIHWNETAMGLHVFPILIPPPTSLSTRSLYVFPLHHQLAQQWPLLLTRLPWWLNGKESTSQCRRPGFDPWVGKAPWRRAWQPIPLFLPGESP